MHRKEDAFWQCNHCTSSWKIKSKWVRVQSLQLAFNLATKLKNEINDATVFIWIYPLPTQYKNVTMPTQQQNFTRPTKFSQT